MLVRFDVAEVAYNLFQSIVRTCAHEVDLGPNKLVNREYVGHLDVQSWLGFRIQVVEFVNVEI